MDKPARRPDARGFVPSGAPMLAARLPLRVLVPVAWALLGSFLFLVFAPDGRPAVAGVCMVTQAFALWVLPSRLRRARAEALPDFLTVFLLFEILLKALTIGGLAFGDLYGPETRDESWDVEPAYQLRAELVFLAGVVLFSLGWWAVERRWVEQPAGKPLSPTPGLHLFYVACFGAYLLLRSLPGAASAGALLPFLRWGALGAVTALLCHDPRTAFGTRGSLVPTLLLLPLFYLAAVSGMKSEVFFVFLPMIASMIKSPNRGAFVASAVFTLLFVAVGTPLSLALRDEQWVASVGRESMGLLDGIARVGDAYEGRDLLRVLAENFVGLCRRASSAEAGGLVMRIAELDGHIGSEPMGGFFGIFVPRMLWPDKPVYAPGAWFTWYLGMAPSPETATSATATMLATEIFWMYGPLGVALAMPALGALYGAAWQIGGRLARRGLMGFGGLFALLAMAPHFEETHTVYAASAPVIILVYAATLVVAEGLIRAASLGRNR